MNAILAVAVKDIMCEFRTKHAVGSVLLFALTSTIAVSFVLGAWGSRAEIAASLLWVVIYFSAMTGLSRSFVREEESQTAPALKLVACPNAVYLGKLLFNGVILFGVELITVPLFVLLTGCDVRNWGTLIAVLVVGSLGLSVGATTAAAMVAKAVSKGALYAVISFPLLLPALAVAIHGSAAAMSGTAAAGDIRLLIYYCGAVLTASLMLFRFIWED